MIKIYVNTVEEALENVKEYSRINEKFYGFVQDAMKILEPAEPEEDMSAYMTLLLKSAIEGLLHKRHTEIGESIRAQARALLERKAASL
jgi:hypothetical protein